MFPSYMLFEIAFCRSLVTTIVTREANTFMNKFNMGVHNSLLSCLVITLITLQFYTGVHNSNMRLEIALCGSFIFTLITLVSYPFMNSFYMLDQNLLRCCFIITFVTKMCFETFVSRLNVEVEVSLRSRCKVTLDTLKPPYWNSLMFGFYMLLQSIALCKLLPTMFTRTFDSLMSTLNMRSEILFG